MKFLYLILLSSSVFPIVSYANVKVSYIGPLTGNYSYYGTSVKNGVEIAIQEYNKGVSEDLKIGFLIKDSNGDIKKGLNLIKELSNDEDCIALIFPTLYDSIQGLYEIVNKLKIVVISPTFSTNSGYSNNQYVFENCLTVDDEAIKIAEYIVKILDKKKIAIIHSEDSYDVNLASVFSKHIKELGSNVISIEKYKSGDTDFREQMLSLGGIDPAIIKEREEKKVHPDEVNPKEIEAIYIAGSWKEVVLIVPQLIFYELRTSIFGCSRWESPYLVEYGGKVLNGAIYTSGFYLKNDAYRTENFVKLFIEKFGKEPDIFSASAYDSACLILEIIKLGCNTKEELKNLLLRVKRFEGITGIISFSGSTKSKRDVPLLLIDNGKIVEIK